MAQRILGPMIPGRALGLGPTTFFVNRERCRLPESLLLMDAMRLLGGVPCSVSLRAGGRFIISSSESRAGAFSEEDVVEIADYDPVRHSVLAIGLKEPSPDTPIHWLAYRTDDTVSAAAFVWDFTPRKAVAPVAEKHPWGSFQEAMALITVARQAGGPAGIEGRGYLVRGTSVEQLIAAVRDIVNLNEKKRTRDPRRKARSQGAGTGRARRASGEKRKTGGARNSRASKGEGG
jgi:hypothetical protein